ncbi:MAG: integrase [Sphingomonadaceae bacterium]|nr:integrase [Sphingomonadaceae bacterium]|tara:strand:+ start:208 stop:1248 length:1041 start_codon:yes stop_codon:yes gene_type:complete
MATISKRNSKWFVQIRRKGFAARYRTFETKTEATAWARHEENQIDLGLHHEGRKADKRLTVRAMLERYKQEVTPQKRGSEPEAARISKMQREPMADMTVIQLSPSAVADYREKRLAEVKPATVRRELSILRHAIDRARKEWGANVARNPVRQIEMPRANDARDRRLEEGEYEALIEGARKMRNSEMEAAIVFAVETAMRRSEILNLRLGDIDCEKATALIRHSKNGYSRSVPLTSRALAVLETLSADGSDLFTISPNALRQGFTRLCRKVEISDLRFHDLRHEAISRFCELGLSIPEVALISGHRDPRMLFRYAHIRPAQLSKKMHRLIEGAAQVSGHTSDQEREV